MSNTILYLFISFRHVLIGLFGIAGAAMTIRCAVLLHLVFNLLESVMHYLSVLHDVGVNDEKQLPI